MDRISSTLSLDEDVCKVKGVSTTRRTLLKKLNINTVRDLLTHFPRRYIDLTNITTTSDATIGEVCTIQGNICDISIKKPRRNLSIIEISVQDSAGLMMLTIFNQIWLAKKYKVGNEIAATGKVVFDYGFKRIINPYIEITDGNPIEGKVLPVHPATEKLSAAMIRNIEREALHLIAGVKDAIPESIRVKRSLMSKGSALSAIHFPHDMAEAGSARTRLAYEELLLLELFLMEGSLKRSLQGIPTAHITDGEMLRKLKEVIPFKLTGEQNQAVEKLLSAMASPQAANHMVLGDVGTGKTIVAAHGIAIAADSHGQSALLAPTEILAMQHFDTLGSLFDLIGLRYALLTGSTPKDEKSFIKEKLAEGELDLLIGTHALLEDDVIFKNLTLAIIDEQQRFGVNQRARLLNKSSAPDALYLTATPIPRTLALAIFGNLTLSYIKEKPNPSSTRHTKVLRRSEKGIAYEAAGKALERNEQVYVICPLIGVELNEPNAENANCDEIDFHPDIAIDDLERYENENPVAAKDEARFLQQKIFPNHKVGILYGSMRSDEKKAVMDSFAAGDIDVLVSTTVIEVGVDVKNATTMIIENADRFGLSQLHQIRGRVGRGDKPAEVFLISASKREEAIYRLRALESSDDGFKLAEYDLALRREGDILGNRQSGTSVLKLVNIMKDAEIIEWAHEDARSIIEDDPKLEKPEHRALKRELGIIFKEDKVTFSG